MTLRQHGCAPGWSDAHGDRLVICPGTQNALFNLLIMLTKPGDVVLTEALTYPGIKPQLHIQASG